MRSSDSTAFDPPRPQPAGRRWGFGAHSVVPYLAHSPTPDDKRADVDDSIRNPVFPDMDPTLRAMRRSH